MISSAFNCYASNKIIHVIRFSTRTFLSNSVFSHIFLLITTHKIQAKIGDIIYLLDMLYSILTIKNIFQDFHRGLNLTIYF